MKDFLIGSIVDCTNQICEGPASRHAMSVTFNKQGDLYTADIRVRITKEEYEAHHERCRQAFQKANPLTGCLDKTVRHG